MERIISFFASPRLTLGCVVSALLLVFFGTLAQVKYGLFMVQKEYFQSLALWMDIPGVGIKIPFPGGYLIGSLLVVNLIASCAMRIKSFRTQLGFFTIHLGLLMLLLGQLATDHLATETHMRVIEGRAANYSESSFETELALVDTSSKDRDTELAIPESMLARQKEIQSAQLPFTIKVRQFYPNSRLANRPENSTLPAAATHGIGQTLLVNPAAQAIKMDERNLPSAIIEIATPSGSQGTWLVSSMLEERQTLTVDNKTWEIGMRLRRMYTPYTITLLKFDHDKYVGTEIPKNFSSRVKINNPATGEQREVVIKMNTPLRYGGNTYYQSSFDPNDKRISILQVVRNPGWITPYLACIIVCLGMGIQFLTNLAGFVSKRRTQ